LSAFEPVRYAALTDVGVKRSHNQDACAAQPAGDAAGWEANGHVFVVADGMGGHAVGEKASAKAVRDIPFLYLRHARDGVATAIRRAFNETNAGIHTIGKENPEFRGLGTTSTALFLRPEGAWVGHVGDSRAYRVRDGVAEQLTFDHSWVWEIARRQGVDPDELGDFKKNVIIRSRGRTRSTPATFMCCAATD
jgi:PPM family protein phosphatase